MDDTLAGKMENPGGLNEKFARENLPDVTLMPKGSEDLLEYVNKFIAQEKEKGRIDELAEEYIYHLSES